MAKKKEATAAPSSDLFAWIDSLFSKVHVEGSPPTYVMHRFIASDQMYAPFARWLGQRVRDPQLVVGCWRALMPQQRGAPRFTYAAAKKPPAAEALAARIMASLGVRRDVAEQHIALAALAGRATALAEEFGIEVAVES